MRRISILVTVLITSLVMALAGLAAIPTASATSSQTVAKSFTFPTGSSDLTKSQKTKIKKAVATAGKNASFRVTGTAGKLLGVSDSTVQLLAKKRGQAVKAYLIKLGVKKSRVTVKLKITELGIVPKTKLVGTYASATPTTYVVGDAGPGGGIIYYVDLAGFKCGSAFTNTGSPTGGECHYLEAAPSGWNIGADPLKPWATGTNNSGNAIEHVSGITDDAVPYFNVLAIGLGLKNSKAIVSQNGITYNASSNNFAAGAARAYAGSSKHDWYLPTTTELNLLCQWARGVPQNVTSRCADGTLNSGLGFSGGPDDFYYWSSSEVDALNARPQGFYNGLQSDRAKYNARFVRPIRAF